MRRLLDLQFVRFVLVGLLNTLFSYLVYAFFLYVGLSYATANLMAMLMGVAFSFQTQRTLVFHNRNRRLIVRFAICWLGIYGFNVTLIGALMQHELNAYAAGALALPFTTLLSYLVQRFLVFGASQPANSVKSTR